MSSQAKAQLFAAIESNDLRRIRELIATGVNINVKGRGGSTPLYMAAEQGNTELVRLLLSTGADPKIKGRHYTTPLFVAASNGHLNVVKLLVQSDRELVNIPMEEGTTPLLVSIQAQFSGIAHYLISNGADVNRTPDGRDETPLYWAISNEDVDLVEALINAGADVNMKSNDNTLLVLATDLQNIDIVHLLINAGADLNALGRTAIESYTPLFVAIGHDNEMLVSVLLNAGADPNIKNSDNTFPLALAAEKGHIGIVSLLLSVGADPNKTGYRHQTPLFLAVETESVEIVRALLEKGADPNIAADDGFTPLCMAAEKNQVEIVKQLLEAHANIELGPFNNGALFYAAYGGSVDVAYLLIEAGADVNKVSSEQTTPLAGAIVSHSADIIEFLLEDGADVNIPLANGHTHLGAAAYEGDVEILQLILGRNPPLTQDVISNMEAGEYTAEIVQMLKNHYRLGPRNIVSNVANVNVPSNNAAANIRNTQAFNFVEYGNVPIRELLENPDVLIIKYGPSYFTLYKSQVEADITSRKNIRFKCKKALAGAPYLKDIEEVPYFYIQGTGNFLVELAALKGAMARYKIIELVDTDIRLEHVASYMSVQRTPGTTLNGRNVNIVSADHCQAGTAQRVYGIKGLRLRTNAVNENVSMANAHGGRRKTRRMKRRPRRNHKSRKVK